MNCNDYSDTPLSAADLFGPALVALVPALCAEAATRDGQRARSARAHQAAARRQAVAARLAAAQAPTADDAHLRAAGAYDAQAQAFAYEARHWQRAANAYANAGQRWQAGWRPTPLPDGQGWTIRSQRAGEPAHVLTYGDDRTLTCSCRAGAASHWALALVIAVEEAQAALETLDGPDAPAGDPWPPDERTAPHAAVAWPELPPPAVPIEAWVWN